MASKAVGPPSDDIIEIVIDDNGNALPPQVYCHRDDQVHWTSLNKTWTITFRGRNPFNTTPFKALPGGVAPPTGKPKAGVRSGSHPYTVTGGDDGDIVIIP